MMEVKIAIDFEANDDYEYCPSNLLYVEQNHHDIFLLEETSLTQLVGQ